MSLEPEPPSTDLVQTLCRRLAEHRAEITKVREDPASALIDDDTVIRHRTAAAELEEHLRLLGVPEDDWHEHADQAQVPEYPIMVEKMITNGQE